MNRHIASVDLQKASKLLNHGPTVLVSSSFRGESNVMAAAWVSVLDSSPLQLTVVVDKATRTRELIENSTRFVIQVPTARQMAMTYELGTRSLAHDPDKLANSGARLFRMDGYDIPFVAGCSAWLACQVIPEPHNQANYDLFISKVVGAWADTRVFRNGRWNFETADPCWRSLHYVAGGTFYTIGDPITVSVDEKEAG